MIFLREGVQLPKATPPPHCRNEDESLAEERMALQLTSPLSWPGNEGRIGLHRGLANWGSV